MKTLTSCLIWLLILALSAWAIASHWQIAVPLQIKHEPRIAELVSFEEQHHFAPDQPQYVKQIIQDADSNSIPAALIPCVELQESSGGKRFNHATFNPFGWDSGKESFASERAAIDYISAKLGNGDYYRGKTLQGKLRAYNPNPAYSIKIINCINNVQ